MENNMESAESATDEVSRDYENYKILGGTFDEKDHASALAKINDTAVANEMETTQAKVIARSAGIELWESPSKDPRVILYGLLQNGKNPYGAKYNHRGLSDQQLFAEALLMLGDQESYKKLIEALPHIFTKKAKQ